MKDYEEKLKKKNKIINDLLTESENIKTENMTLEQLVKEKKQAEEKINQELQSAIQKAMESK